MPIHIDHPVPGIHFDPLSFKVRGWLWLEDRHGEIAAVEARDGEVLLGEMEVASFQERADVSSKFNLPAGTRTGFELSARHPTAVAHEPFVLSIRARLNDGTHTPILSGRLLAPPPPERHPLEMLGRRVKPGALGLEIGAHERPVGGLSPFYTDTVAEYAGTAGRVDFLADARTLPLADNTLDYLCSSHVLEHLPNPIAALHEWHRVLRAGGYLYLVVPDKRFTFDEPRQVTSCEHLLRDFEHGTTAADAAVHIDEFVFQTDWSVLSPRTPLADVAQHRAATRDRYLTELAQGLPIDIHYHTFTPDSLDMVLRAAGFLGGNQPMFQRLAHAERYPPGRDDGIALLLQKTGDPISAAPHQGGTFALPANSAGLPPLPLVCPISLSPLRIETAANGEATLVATASGLRYPMMGKRPSLLPPINEQPIRPWNDEERRRAASRTSAASSAGAPSISNITIRSHLDEPAPSTVLDPLCFFVRGWLWLEPVHEYIVAVEAWVGDTLVGETMALYERADVIVVHWLKPGTRTGFELFAHYPAANPNDPITVEIRARLADGTRTPVVFSATRNIISRDYRTNHFGILLNRETTAIQQRRNVFAEGHSSAVGSVEVGALLRRYLGPPPARVLDVGCGLASYGRGLLADGYDWIGAEVDAADCAELVRLGLPHRQVDGKTLPFADGTFDSAMCIEVLEHIADPHAFLREVSRVAPRQIIVSVPNCELLGYLWNHLAVPWHMLEADHKNFFTRWSLGELLRPYYPRVELRFHTPYPLSTLEGTPLHYHLFAVGRRPA